MKELVKWIPTQFERLEPDQKITVFKDENAAIVGSNSMRYGYLMEQVAIVDFTGVLPDGGSWCVKDVLFDCVAFELCQYSRPEEASVNVSIQPDHENQETVTDLPNESLHGLWDSYVDLPISSEHIKSIFIVF